MVFRTTHSSVASLGTSDCLDESESRRFLSRRSEALRLQDMGISRHCKTIIQIKGEVRLSD